VTAARPPAAGRRRRAEALALLDHFGYEVAVGVATCVAVLDSQLVILGGG
jgi:predicted NBD/HSP70 family sugar kinase